MILEKNRFRRGGWKVLEEWWAGAELNCRHRDFQSRVASPYRTAYTRYQQLTPGFHFGWSVVEGLRDAVWAYFRPYLAYSEPRRVARRLTEERLIGAGGSDP